MFIEVRTDCNIKSSEDYITEVKDRVHSAMSHYDDRIRRIDVHLSDVVGNRAGYHDKCCLIEARRDGREPIVVKHQESTMGQAIHGAILSLKKSAETALGKEASRDNLRDHH